jgi:uncharacterized membrane protein
MSVPDWLNLALRWVHVVAAIGWIGSSFYFIWLDQNLERPGAGADPELEGSLWMTHSGGFYRVERRRVGPGRMPATLHWFQWEAALTWLSGAALLVLVYYASGGLFLLDPARPGLGQGAAVATGVLVLAAGWLAYDALWTWGGRRHERLALGVSLLLLAAAAVTLCRLLPGRAAYLHVGAMLGTIMAANVWVRILPAQRRMTRAAGRGEEPDLADSSRAKRRSVHNSYLTFPVLFLMLSPHYPGTWGHPWNALVLLLLVAAGMCARHLMIGRGPGRYAALAPLAAAAVLLVALVPSAALVPHRAPGRTLAAGAVPAFADVQAVVRARCIACHSRQPRIAYFGAAPGGISFDDPATIRRYAARLEARVVETRTMPLENITGMTDAERALLARWIAAGAPGDTP